MHHQTQIYSFCSIGYTSALVHGMIEVETKYLDSFDLIIAFYEELMNIFIIIMLSLMLR